MVKVQNGEISHRSTMQAVLIHLSQRQKCHTEAETLKPAAPEPEPEQLFPDTQNLQNPKLTPTLKIQASRPHGFQNSKLPLA